MIGIRVGVYVIMGCYEGVAGVDSTRARVVTACIAHLRSAAGVGSRTVEYGREHWVSSDSFVWKIVDVHRVWDLYDRRTDNGPNIWQ